MAIPQALRWQVWREFNGRSYEGRCFCCDEIISIESWHCSHIISRFEGGPEISSNLRPCCQGCNTNMGTTNMYDFIRKYEMPGLKNLSRSEKTSSKSRSVTLVKKVKLSKEDRLVLAQLNELAIGPPPTKLQKSTKIRPPRSILSEGECISVWLYTLALTYILFPSYTLALTYILFPRYTLSLNVYTFTITSYSRGN